MRPFCWKLLPLGLLTVLLGGLAAAGAVRAASAGGPPDDPMPVPGPVTTAGEEPPLVDLAELRRDPLAHRSEPVRFVLQFQGLVPDWDPYLTRFGAADWIAFSGWSDTRFTWDADVFEDPLPTLFVRRDGGLAMALAALRPYARVEVTAVVREVFLDRPWLEVTALRPLTELVGEGTILHVGRAHDFMRKAQWELALQQLERAKAAPLPAHARAELERQILECHHAQEAGSRRRD